MRGRFVFTLALLAACAMPLASCKTPEVKDRATLAADIAHPAGFKPRRIHASPFKLAAWERVREKGQPVTVYIEGDGFAWRSRTVPSTDPTPTNPVALRLAARDDASNVVYIARPCQYGAEKNCERDYWTSARFAPEVVHAMNKALDDIKSRHGVSGFHLVGYSGGGAIAALLAARRGDVRSLRTVAAPLDTDAFTELHRVSPLDGLNPADIADKLKRLPQRHFVGANDAVVPPALVRGFAEEAGRRGCAAVEVVPGTSHENGWAPKWQGLLRHGLPCDRNS